MPRGRKKTKSREVEGYALELSPEIKKSILIIALVAVGGISFLSLFGLAGVAGEYVNHGLSLLLGWGKIIFPALVLAGAFLLYNEDEDWVRGYTYVGLFFFIIAFQSLIHIFYSEPEAAARLGTGGGYVGLFLTKVLVGLIGFWAGLLVILCILAISLMLLFNATMTELMGAEGRFGAVTAPVRLVWGKVRGRGGEDEEDEEEEDGDYDEEIDEESEYEEGEDDLFSSRNVADGEEIDEAADAPVAAPAAAGEDDGPKVRRSNIKIKLPLDLLSAKRGKPSGADVNTCKEIIKRTMENFGIPVEMGEVSVGPTVTQYTFKPAEGVKLNRITGLANDLALALAMHPIRIEAPIPGRSLVGVEVPNKQIARVGLREILDTKSFKKRKVNTMIALGKDVAGEAWLADLAKMPHLLVAGQTGSGKSVCLNAIIVSLMYQNNPDDLKFIMVDPKRVELTVYNHVPYLLTPVITDVPKTINALKWCLGEMERRFDVLAQAGKRNIDSYNASTNDTLPYIVFVIDELADLMVAAARDVEGAIIRLAQMARAVGIHLILATQRPSVDVITGLIKANVPGRIAFSVSSSIDSRTILDTMGAEKLLGRGDMLLLTNDIAKPKRIQGAFIDDKEIKRIVRAIREQAGEPEYIEAITAKSGGSAAVGGGDDDGDELMGEAREIVINSGKASTSFLQRRLRIGYARAARLIDLLEEAGIVGPANGSKPREILMSKEEYAKVSEEGMAGAPLHDRAESSFNAATVFGTERSADEESDDDEDAEYDEEEARVTYHGQEEAEDDESVTDDDGEEETDETETDEEDYSEEGEEDEDETEEDDDDDDDDDDDLPPVADLGEEEEEEDPEEDNEDDEDEEEKIAERWFSK